jgi:uncharacterized membrane protein YkvI
MNSTASIFQRLLLPAFAFQAVVIGGGYATGRELVEFFMAAGPWGGILGLIVTMVLFSAVCMVTFRFAQMTSSFDYRSFFKNLLGPGWIVFEIALFALVLLILSVAAAACGQIALLTFDVPTWVGIGLFALAVIGITYAGSHAVDGLFKYWSMLLYVVYAVFLVACILKFHDRIGAAFANFEPRGDWLRSGVAYTGYNVASAVLILHTLRHAIRPRDTLIAGALCGPLAMLPALAFFVALAGFEQDIQGVSIPSNFLLERIGWPTLQIVYQVMIFGAIVETGVGLLHAINERIAGVVQSTGRTLSHTARGAVAAVSLFFALTVAEAFGLIGLIANGYGTLTWVFIVVFVFPVLTYGVWAITRKRAPLGIANGGGLE